MKTQHLSLDEGILTFTHNNVVIEDFAKKRENRNRLIMFSQILYAIPTTIRGFKDEDFFFPFWVWYYLYFGFMLL